MSRLCDCEVEIRIRFDTELPSPDTFLKLIKGVPDPVEIVFLPPFSSPGGRGTFEIHSELKAPLNVSN